MTCSILDCVKASHAKGFCRAHYDRLRTYGDPLGGAPVRATPGELLRFIHDVALLHTSDQCLIWPFRKNRDGYGTLKVDGKMTRANRYVCGLVKGSPPTPKHEAAHSCGHESCISPIHLSWKTRTENEADKIAHGTRLRGEQHPQAKLTEADVRKILALKGIESQPKLAKRFGVSPMTVCRIHAGRKWAWMRGQPINPSEASLTPPR